MKYYTSTTQFNCGIDLQCRQMYVCLMERQGRILVHTNVRSNDLNFLKLVGLYGHDLTVCAEGPREALVALADPIESE